jgi:hypothetical protein
MAKTIGEKMTNYEARKRELEKTFNYTSYCPIYCSNDGGYWQNGKFHVIDPDVHVVCDVSKNERCAGKFHVYTRMVRVGEDMVETEFALPCPAQVQLNKLLKGWDE